MNKKNYVVAKISILGVMAFLLLLILIVLLSGDFKRNFFFVRNTDYNLVYSEEFSADEINKFSFDLISADLDVMYSSDEKIRLEIYDSEENKVNVTNSNKGLEVKFDKFRGLCFGICNINRKAKLYLPEELVANINAVSASGDIFVDDFLNLSGYIKTTSGDIEIIRMKELDVKSTSGEIVVMNSIDTDASTSSGDMILKNVFNLKFESTSGDIEISNVNNVTGRTISGEIDIKKLNDSVDIKTTSGDIEMEYVLLNKNSFISTVSGEVEVRLVKAINVDVSTISGEKEIYNFDRNSDITLKISTTSGDIEVN